MSITTHLITAEELFLLENNGMRHELVKGELLTMSPTKRKHGRIVANLTIRLGHYVLTHKLGAMYAAETGFKLASNPDTVLAPDIAFIRGPVDDSSESDGDGAPDLVVEVQSPNGRKAKVEEKAARWLTLGASVVWLIDPKRRTVQIHLSNDDPQTLTEDDELTGGDLIPGFSVRVFEIFSY
jgi:Uma2 family endonuclease